MSARPAEGAAAQGDLDRHRPPPPGSPRRFRFPSFSRHRLTSGLELIVAPVARAPLVVLELLTPGGGTLDPEGGEGLATFTAALLDDGSSRRPAREIAAAAERLGGTLATAAGWDAAHAYVSLASRHLPAGLELLAEVAADPAFPPAEVERERRRRQGEIVRRRDHPGPVADDRMLETIYRGTPYGHPLIGYEESLERLDRERVTAFYSGRYRAAGSTLVAVGDVDPEAVVAVAETVLADLPAGEPPAVPAIAPPPARRRVLLVDRPQATQTELRIGQPGIPRSHPDFLPLRLANLMLGGKFTSRLNLNLREKRGLTYGVQSVLTGRRGPGPFYVTTAVSTDGVATAAGEILAEIDRLRHAPPPGAELADAGRYLVGAFPFTLQSLDGIANRLEELAIHRLGDDEFDLLAERVGAVTPAEIERAAGEHLTPERAVVVAVGPAAELEPQLEGLGEIEVVG